MKRFLDTSVLVATVLTQHPQHAPSVALYAKSDKLTTCCALHSIAETYSVVTRLPARLRMTGEQALLFLEDLRERVAIVTPSEEDYLSTITSAATADIIGGAVYDALIACCAIKSDSEMIYTWNVADFRRLGPDIARRVRTP